MQPRGATPRSRSGAEAGRTPCPKVGGQEELPHVRGRGRGGGGREEIPHALKPEARGSRQEELPHAPTLKARGGGREEQPHAAAAWAQEGLEELSHAEGQEGQR